MKVLHIINNLGSGGAEKLLEGLLPIMNNLEDVKIDLLLLSDTGNVFDKGLLERGVNIDVIPLRKNKNPINVLYIKNYIVNGKYDVVHAHLFPTIYWVSIASRLIFKGKPKFIYTEHSTHNRRRSKNILKPLERFVYSCFSKIISISDDVQKNLVSFLRPKEKNIHKFTIIYNGIDLNRFIEAEVYDKYKINKTFTEDTILICMVGRFSNAKDQPTIIKAMCNLPEHIHLLLVGEGPLEEYNKQLAKKHGVSERVHFLGFRNDIERILKTSDIIIQSSNWEGFGLTAVEGMAAGKPVIASDIEGLRYLVGGAGILFEKGNYIELTRKIIRLIIDTSHYNATKEKCFMRSKKYDIRQMANNHIDLYKTIVEGGRDIYEK